MSKREIVEVDGKVYVPVQYEGDDYDDVCSECAFNHLSEQCFEVSCFDEDGPYTYKEDIDESKRRWLCA